MKLHRITQTALLVGAVSAIALGSSGLLVGQTILIDDFNDGNDDGWTRIDLSASQPWGPGVYDASSGSYNIRHAGIVPADTPAAEKTMISLWDGSAAPRFSDGILRATIRTNEPNNSTTVAMRFDVATFTGYTLIANTGSNVFNLQKFVNGAESPLWRSADNTYGVGEDWNVELAAVDDQISAKVWKVGDPEPALPQFQGIDSDVTLGQIGLGSDTTGAPSFVDGQGDGTFDNIFFTFIPEPTSFASMLSGVIGFLLLRWRHRFSG